MIVLLVVSSEIVFDVLMFCCRELKDGYCSGGKLSGNRAGGEVVSPLKSRQSRKSILHLSPSNFVFHSRKWSVLTPINIEYFSKDGACRRWPLPSSGLKAIRQSGSSCAKTILPQSAPALQTARQSFDSSLDQPCGTSRSRTIHGQSEPGAQNTSAAWSNLSNSRERHSV